MTSRFFKIFRVFCTQKVVMMTHCGLCCCRMARFEGFDAALESANAEITSGEQELRAASLANLALQRTAPAREQLR